jgi:hypothetical protein
VTAKAFPNTTEIVAAQSMEDQSLLRAASDLYQALEEAANW